MLVLSGRFESTKLITYPNPNPNPSVVIKTWHLSNYDEQNPLKTSVKHVSGRRSQPLLYGGSEIWGMFATEA